MPDHVVDRVTAKLSQMTKNVNGFPLLVIGLACNMNSADARKFPAITIEIH